MLLRRFFQARLAQATYLIACSASREAIVIDPHRDVKVFLAAARAEGVRITAVTETHVHADFLSGSRDLAGETGAQLYLSGAGRGPWSYTDDFVSRARAVLLRDGDVIRIGAVRLETLHTPGHTPEHLTFLVTDTAAAGEPMGAVTGDFLFVGDVGRPDLLERAVHVVGSADGAARQLYHSLGRLTRYPDYLQLWPGHSAGSACGKGLSAVPQSTLGYERRHNWALCVEDEEAFVSSVLEGQPEPPAYFADMKRLNARGSAPLKEIPPPAPMSSEDVAAAMTHGVVVIDGRLTEEYAAGHIPGTMHIPMDRSFVTWMGSLVPLGAQVVLVGEQAQLAAAVDDLRLIGMDHVVGCASAEVVQAWRESGKPLQSVAGASPDDVAARVHRGGVTVLDVRTPAEWTQSRIPGATHIPLTELPSRIGEIQTDQPVIVHCQGGARSAIAASLLQARGFTAVEDLRGGLNAWREAGHGVVTDPCAAA